MCCYMLRQYCNFCRYVSRIICLLTVNCISNVVAVGRLNWTVMSVVFVWDQITVTAFRTVKIPNKCFDSFTNYIICLICFVIWNANGFVSTSLAKVIYYVNWSLQKWAASHLHKGRACYAVNVIDNDWHWTRRVERVNNCC